VVRVEPIGGDQTRRLIGSGAGYFPMYNRGKQSICLDLKSAGWAGCRQGSDRAAQMCWWRISAPARSTRLGLDYASCAAANPRLIYCSEKGLSARPLRKPHRALDEVAQMMGGLAYMTGPPGRPLCAQGASVIDVTGGMFGVIGVLAALEERHRSGHAGRR
jgi:crotonobetainyl-CoA:carnitine CoA-transferase CaiB-like acyl-CoA transferase